MHALALLVFLSTPPAMLWALTLPGDVYWFVCAWIGGAGMVLGLTRRNERGGNNLCS
jgi:hypothetical protein